MPLQSPLTAASSSSSAAAATSPAAATTSSTPISPLPQHPRPQHQQQAPFPFRAPTPHLPSNPHEPSLHPFLYPFIGGGGGGFIPKGVRPLSPADQLAGYLPSPLHSPAAALMYSHGVHAMASPHLDYINHALNLTRPSPPHLPYAHPVHASDPAAVAASKGGSVRTKGAPRLVASDGNGYKDKSTRERRRDGTLSIVRNRRVRIEEDASMYALCRSWLRNGINEEIQPQKKDLMQSLPKPLPASMVACYESNEQEDEKDEDEPDEDEKSVDHLSPQDLLKMHIKRAKRVKERQQKHIIVVPLGGVNEIDLPVS